MGNKYLEPVWEAFDGAKLNEAQLAAALGFQWNTGKIKRVMELGGFEKALLWQRPASLVHRRKREQRLFFNEQWPGNLNCPVYPVRKPSYTPDFRHAESVNLLSEIKTVMNMK